MIKQRLVCFASIRYNISYNFDGFLILFKNFAASFHLNIKRVTGSSSSPVYSRMICPAWIYFKLNRQFTANQLLGADITISFYFTKTVHSTSNSKLRIFLLPNTINSNSVFIGLARYFPTCSKPNTKNILSHFTVIQRRPRSSQYKCCILLGFVTTL